jgi:hypothetical protein
MVSLLRFSDFSTVTDGDRCVHFMSAFEALCISTAHIDILLQSE